MLLLQFIKFQLDNHFVLKNNNMQNMKKTIEKKMYVVPEIDIVVLDNEISLALESPPAGPDEGINTTPNYFNNNPYKDSLV